MGAKSGQSKKSAGFNRLALIIFGALFVVLFAGYAIAEGIGKPSVPSGDVAMVQSVSDGNISEAEFKLALVQQIAGSHLKKTPKVGSKKYEEVKEKALGELLDSIWLRGEAEELGISVTNKQVATALAKIKKESFPTPAAYAEFLKTSHFTPADVVKRVKLQKLSEEIQAKVTTESQPATSAEIADYYNASKAQYTTKPSRDIRVVVNKDKAKAEAAKAALAKDDSAANWKVVAKKYSEDPSTNEKGGLQAGITEELLQGGLKKAIFGSATGEVVGPVDYQKNFLVLEVEKLNPEKIQTLDEVRSQISAQLTQTAQQEHFSEFVAEYQSKWVSRTVCAADFLVEGRCSNFKGSGHPATAPPACYEANPKVPATECPAPVEQTKPQLPGSATALKPTGERLVQRPQPQAAAKAAGEAASPAAAAAAKKAVEEAAAKAATGGASETGE